MNGRCLMLVAGAMGLAACTSAPAALPAGAGKVPFWIAMSDPAQIDRQAARLLANHAVAIVLRYPQAGTGSADSRALVARLHEAAPGTPVLMYTWASRSSMGKSGFVANMDWANRQGGAMMLPNVKGRPMRGFGNVLDPDYRDRTASSIAAAMNRDGFDGIAIDMAIRTPRYRPGPLVRLCQRDESFCGRYADGMDAVFEAIRAQLDGKPILFNGLWNFGPGSVADQQQLLAHADAAAVEYFGDDPHAFPGTFAHDVLPFLSAIASAPASKKIFVFGRGSWGYTDYAQDYAWQRYLYCSYLLGAKPNSYYKYHATFQLDTPHGRTGGLAVYADWGVDPGSPRHAFEQAGDVYSRQFAHGLVLVAPIDGKGGTYTLATTMYSADGVKYRGKVELAAGDGLLLLDHVPARPGDEHLLDLALFSDWPGATVSGQGKATQLALDGDTPVGSHDMLLDPVRTLHPREQLELDAMPESSSSRIQLVAEVDDPSRQHAYAVVDVHAQGASPADGSALGFRTNSSAQGAMPVVAGPTLAPGAWALLKLNGPAVFAHSGLRFRRWAFARFDGAIRIRSVGLSE